MHRPELCFRSTAVRSINPVLEVGQVTEQVEVQANAALVETRNAGVGAVVENTRILELPLNGRAVIELVALAGAATPAPIFLARVAVILSRRATFPSRAECTRD